MTLRPSPLRRGRSTESFGAREPLPVEPFLAECRVSEP